MILVYFVQDSRYKLFAPIVLGIAHLIHFLPFLRDFTISSINLTFDHYEGTFFNL